MEKIEYADKKCLIVEDRRPFLMLLKGLLSGLGARNIATAFSAEEGIKTCKQRSFDIIISDLQLGANRKNGFEFLEELRKRRLIKPTTIFIMISGDSSRSMVLGSLEKQPDDYLIKPFSQAQLNSRISRAAFKRNALGSLYSQIEHGKLELCIESCKHLIDTHSKYTRHCQQMLVQLYWKTSQYEAAESLLDGILKERKVPWAKSSMAKTQIYLGNYSEAIKLASAAIQHTKNDVDAYDTLADAFLKAGKKSESLEIIKRALILSPHSIERHFKMCEIARENDDYETAKQSSQAIWDLSKRSVHKNVDHLCTYVRSILDAAENATDNKDKNRFKQEAMIVMQRSQFDDVITRIDHEFDFSIFDKLVQARLMFLENKLTDAKRHLEESQIAIEEKFGSFPPSLITDSLKSMFDLADFEEAGKLYDSIDDKSLHLDANMRHSIENEVEKASIKRSEYIKLNKAGIILYREGKHLAAYDAFINAKKVAPVNIGVTLNLLQCLVKLIERTDTPDQKLVKECKEHYRFVKNMPLKPVHQKKFNGLEEDILKFTGK